MKKRFLLNLCLAFVCFFAISFKAEAAFDYKPVAFVLLDYSESVESSTPFTYRVSEGTIQLVKAP